MFSGLWRRSKRYQAISSSEPGSRSGETKRLLSPDPKTTGSQWLYDPHIESSSSPSNKTSRQNSPEPKVSPSPLGTVSEQPEEDLIDLDWDCDSPVGPASSEDTKKTDENSRDMKVSLGARGAPPQQLTLLDTDIIWDVTGLTPHVDLSCDLGEESGYELMNLVSEVREGLKTEKFNKTNEDIFNYRDEKLALAEVAVEFGIEPLACCCGADERVGSVPADPVDDRRREEAMFKFYGVDEDAVPFTGDLTLDEKYGVFLTETLFDVDEHLLQLLDESGPVDASSENGRYTSQTVDEFLALKDAPAEKSVKKNEGDAVATLQLDPDLYGVLIREAAEWDMVLGRGSYTSASLSKQVDKKELDNMPVETAEESQSTELSPPREMPDSEDLISFSGASGHEGW